MGGHPGGDVAACLAIRALVELDQDEPHGDPSERLRAAVLRADQSIVSHTTEHPELGGMGTTFTAMLCVHEHRGLPRL
jgi:protein phosphatase